ncbi:MAG: hypothetical protein RLZ55_601 [Actinomycetota bacterium]
MRDASAPGLAALADRMGHGVVVRPVAGGLPQGLFTDSSHGATHHVYLCRSECSSTDEHQQLKRGSLTPLSSRLIRLGNTYAIAYSSIWRWFPWRL